ncbi:PDR/VanB family oxidoreductase [Xanthobacter sediminis]
MASSTRSEAPLPDGALALRLDAVRRLAVDVVLLELVRPEGVLPPASPGAHVDLHLPGGLVRQYSLVTPLCRADRYAVAVKREAQGRGGSRWLHDELRVGARLPVGRPRNHFELEETGEDALLLAGGIGITPLYAMFRHLKAAGRPVQLHYWCRSRDHALFGDELAAAGDAHLHPGDAPARPRVADVLGAASPRARVYCCGPAPMLEEAAAHVGVPTRLHVERFAPAVAVPAGAAADFVVHLARTGRDIPVTGGASILSALVAAGVDVPYSCEEGLCGACETRLLDGLPLHRDSVRSPEEHARRATVIVCCAGSRSPRLVLDL